MQVAAVVGDSESRTPKRPRASSSYTWGGRVSTIWFSVEAVALGWLQELLLEAQRQTGSCGPRGSLLPDVCSKPFSASISRGGFCFIFDFGH